MYMNGYIDDDAETSPPPTTTTTSTTSLVDTMARLRLLDTKNTASLEHDKDLGSIGKLPSSELCNAVSVLLASGVVLLEDVLSVTLCDKLLESINETLSKAVLSGIPLLRDNGFGNVMVREHRWDMYLPCDNLYKQALEELLGSPTCKLAVVFEELFGGPAEFYEFSALVSDRGASSQPIHPDTKYQSDAPLYTVFIALQDVTELMGPTVFLTCTHDNEITHQNFNDPSKKNGQVAASEFQKGLIKKGDVVIMDSRLLHFGSGNTDQRRVLMYFTLKNPRVMEFHCMPGSLMTGLKLSTKDLVVVF